jgi:hypothetical protein
MKMIRMKKKEDEEEGHSEGIWKTSIVFQILGQMEILSLDAGRQYYFGEWRK